MTFEEANKILSDDDYSDKASEATEAFDVHVRGSICERCVHRNDCVMMDLDDYNEIIEQCNFMEEY